MNAEPGQGMTARDNGNARASDADRERAIDVLEAAFAEGQLTMEEHSERVQRGYRSRTYAELAELSADLPAGPLGTLSGHGSVFGRAISAGCARDKRPFGAPAMSASGGLRRASGRRRRASR